ncbi:hypothetical protein I8J29_05560 [Paenibacillus sp. MWE-103]|uniref:Uncharacterized protein n=1 Tax=Paenibacillus artemisiicola TaxID=1172618 RepID=A0ABS3W5T4_9BACL|nr:hypothetical protein [Paenibacillus artemisiicola]MBO7743653.1 hypothetical protein [Paenibacillus artemisiicola]
MIILVSSDVAVKSNIFDILLIFHFLHATLAPSRNFDEWGGDRMLNHYAIEKLMKLQQNELEQRARQAWKREKSSTNAEAARRERIFKQTTLACCPVCC